MPVPTFVPPISPSPGGSLRPKLRLNEAEFGDGYTQTSPKGINHIKRVIDLTWEALTLAQKDVISDFLIAQGGYLPFYYTPYGFGAAGKWICKEWTIDQGPPWSVKMKLEENYSF